jgi:hypothetical protein
MNQIVEVKLNEETLYWSVEIVKRFDPQHGGGYQLFREDGGLEVHGALDVAREMVTVLPGSRTDLVGDVDTWEELQDG